MDPAKARLNELCFSEFCIRILSIRNRMLDIKEEIAHLGKYFKFDIEKVSKISEKIFLPTFKLNISEVYCLLDLDYLKIEDLRKLFKVSNRTIYRHKMDSKDNILYPRLDKDEQEALDEFITQYNKYFVRNFNSIIDIEREEN